MNHRSRYRKKMQAQQAQAGGGHSAMPQIFDVAGHGFDGANQGNRRGYLQHLPLDTSRELTGGAWLQILKSARWLYANNGYARFICNGLSGLIGYYGIQPATKDRAWNRLAEAHWKNRTKTPFAFDRCAKLNHATWQLALNRGKLRDGDMTTVLMQADSGSALIVPYEAHQINSGSNPFNGEKNLRDGVYLDSYGRHLAYRITANNYSNDSMREEVFAKVDANSCIFHADFESVGRVRGVSALAHAINDLIDLTEIDADTKLGIKRAQYIGIYRKSAKPTSNGPTGLFTSPTPIAAPDTLSSKIVGGTETTQKNLVLVEDAQDGGGIAGLGDGEDYGTISADNPGPNEREFTKTLLSKIALGIGLPPSVVFAIAGLTGPEVRLHMGLLKRWIEVELLRLYAGVSKHYAYFWAREFEKGFPMPNDPEWWQAIYVPQSDLTIDRGREGNLALAELKVGATTLAEIWEQKGCDWEDKLEAQADIIARAAAIAAERGLTMGDIMPDWNPMKQQNQQQQQQTQP